MRIVHVLATALVFAALCARLAFADPAISVRYEPGAAIVRLEGDYSHQWYSVARGETRDGPWTAMMDAQVLCLGECAVSDERAAAGRTYWYRFDLQRADGSFVSYGPYPVTISSAIERRVEVRVTPQPVRGPARVEIVLAGHAGEAPARVRALLFDLQGRRVATIHDGLLPRGRTALAWDGRDAGGRSLAAGLYVLRVESPLGAAASRIVRAR